VSSAASRWIRATTRITYVSVGASGDYEVFREGQSPQSKRADELAFAQDAHAQLLPNLLIHFRWAA